MGSARRVTVPAFLVVLVGSLLLGVAVTPAGAVTRVNCAVASLQSAIDAAEPGSILVVEGTCVGSFEIDRSVTLRGAGVLDAERGGRVLTICCDAVVTIRNLTLTNGLADQGGGVLIAGSEDATALHLRGGASIVGNEATGIGGGVLNLFGRLMMGGTSSIVGNIAAYGGGVWTYKAIVAMSGRSSLVGNRALRTGGGIDNFGVLTLDRHASIVRNRARFGGGVLNWGGSVASLRDGATISRNKARWSGGGVLNRECDEEYGAAVVDLGGSSALIGNVAGTAGRAGFGGGVYNVPDTTCEGPLHLRDAIHVVRNRAISGGSGGGVYGSISTLDPTVTFRGNIPNDCDPACEVPSVGTPRREPGCSDGCLPKHRPIPAGE